MGKTTGAKYWIERHQALLQEAADKHGGGRMHDRFLELGILNLQLQVLINILMLHE